MSVKEWKKMRRKQQELVLKVWENVLETMKFRAAKDKGDFGTSLHGLYEPKTTPFDTALAVLRELSGTPKFHNSCPGCVLLGNYKSGLPSMELNPYKIEPLEEQNTDYDLYYCNQGNGINKPMLIARFSDAPGGPKNDKISEGQVLDGIFNPDSTVGQDMGFMTSEPRDCKHPALVIAREKALELALVEYEQCYPDG